jgi:hypothetical protein
MWSPPTNGGSDVDPENRSRVNEILSRPDWARDSTMNRTRHTAEQIIRKLKTA